jgi:hypothetical protein
MAGMMHLSSSPMVDLLFKESYYPLPFTTNRERRNEKLMGSFKTEFVYVMDSERKPWW